MHLSAKERGRIGGLFLVDGSGGAGVIASRRRLGRRPDRPLTAALAATLTAALATTFVAALLTATLVAADGRGVLLHLATARGRSVLLHLATAGRRSVLLHLAAISDFFAAFRSRYRRVAANGGAALDVLARAFDRSANRCAAVSPERRRQAVEGIRGKYGLSERHACRIVGQHRGTQRYTTIVRADEDALTRAIISLASICGRPPNDRDFQRQ